MSGPVHRGIGYSVEREGNEVKVLLPYLDHENPVVMSLGRPSVSFPADALAKTDEGEVAFSDMTDCSVIEYVCSNIG